MQLASSMGGAGDAGVHSTNVHSRVESAALRLVELCEKLEHNADRYADAIAEAEALIARVKNPKYREVLAMRYIEGMQWREISATLGYKDEKSVYRLHGWALQDADNELHHAV